MSNKDLYCSYYTNSHTITSYMVKMLDIKNEDLILEPAAGEGIFVDEIIKTDKTVHIDALDINSTAINIMKEKYKNNPNIVVRETDTLLDKELDKYLESQLWLKKTDTLLDENLDLFKSIGGHYTKIIGNPPYGAWQDYEKRELLKERFPGHYVKETYSMFLLRCLSLLKMGGRLSFIIPDTFLFLNMHSRLRDVLFRESKIIQILIFPSKFFPGISFAYSNLSIITLERSDMESSLENVMEVVTGFKSSNEFLELYTDKQIYPRHLKVYNIKQKDIIKSAQNSLILADSELYSILNYSKITLGDVADVVTGLYTGNNAKFIRTLNKNIRGSKNYEVIDKSLIYDCSSPDGIDNVIEGYIPYIKSSSQNRYVRQIDEWFVRWDSSTIKYYNTNKKSRFQNSSFYFKTGIGLPMVKSNTIKAFLMKDRVFDQSIVGVFPKDISKLFYILALMNSDVVNDLIHAINPTANNSANYIKQIPYIEPDIIRLEKITTYVSNILNAYDNGNFDVAERIHKKINKEINIVYYGLTKK